MHNPGNSTEIDGSQSLFEIFITDFLNENSKRGFTIFPNVQAKRKRFRQGMGLSQLNVDITRASASSKGELHLLSGARFGNKRSRAGSLRHNANVLGVSAFVGDYDGEVVRPDKAARILKRAGLRFLIYTSPSHSPDKPRWRVICPASEECAPDEYRKWAGRVNGLLGGILARESFVVSQSYYFGQVEGATPLESDFHDSGRYIDQCSELDVGAIFPAPERPEREHGTGPKEPMGLTIPQAVAILEASEVDWSDYFEWMEALGAMHHEFGGDLAAFEAIADLAAQSDKFDYDANLEKWERGFDDDKPNAKTLRSYNYELGPDHPAYFDEHGLSDADIIAMFDEIDADTAHDDAEHAGGLLKFYTARDCENESLDSPYVVKGLCAQGEVAQIVADSSVGKTTIGLHLAYGVAQGRSICGKRVKQGRTLYIAAENERNIRKRVKPLLRQYGDAGYEFQIVGNVKSLREQDGKPSPYLRELRTAIKRERPSLIVIDTLRAAFAGIEENDSKGMGEVYSVASSLAKLGPAVIVLHHKPKHGDGRGVGSALLFNNAAISIELTKDENTGVVTGKALKNQDGETGVALLAFRNERVDLGPDSDGDETRTVICREVDPQNGMTSEVRELPKGAKAGVLNVLREITEGPDGAGRDDWHKAYKHTRPKDDDDAVRVAFGRAVKWLEANKWVERRGANYFPVIVYGEIQQQFGDDDGDGGDNDDDGDDDDII